MVIEVLIVLGIAAAVGLFFWLLNWSVNRSVARFERGVDEVMAAYRAEADAAPQDMETQERIAAKHQLIAKSKGEQLGRSLFW